MAVLSELPTEILAQILCHLPVKDLGRFSCTSKSGNNLIKSPNFIKIHLNQTLNSNSHRHLLLSITGSSLSSAALNNLRLSLSELVHPLQGLCRDYIELWGSCNGVVCISYDGRSDVALYNPSTKTYRMLPPTKLPTPGSSQYSVFGFGYDSVTDDYKVLRMIQCYGANHKLTGDARVYSFKHNTWNQLNVDDHVDYFRYRMNDFNVVIVNEVLHYVINDVQCAAFDFRTESFSLVECPDYGDNYPPGRKTICLGNLDEHLSIAINHNSDELGRGSSHVWIMNEYGKRESWTELCRINKQERLTRFTGLYVRPLAWSCDRKSVLCLVDNELCWYIVDYKRVARAKVKGLGEEDFDARIFVESLVMLDENKVQSGLI